ncbi:mitochondrial proton/calcium exchanger protein-like protein isoform X1, partial [Tanacetum coccineum]
MQEVILFYNRLVVQTRQILDSKCAIPSKTAVDAKVAIQEMAKYSQKWQNGTSRTRSTETSDGLAAIQAQLNNFGREIKKVNEKVYAAQIGCEQCKGPHYTKDYPLKEEGKTLKEAYYTQFGRPFQGGGYKVAAPGFYQRNNANLSYQERKQSMEETLSKFMRESMKRHEENSNMIKEIYASTDAAVLQEIRFGSIPSYTEANPIDHVKSISTTSEADSNPIRRIGSPQYAVSTSHNRRFMFESRQMIISFPSRLNNYYCEEKKGSYGPQFSEAYSYEASHIDKSIPRKEKDPWSFTLPCYINNVCFDNALADLGANSWGRENDFKSVKPSSSLIKRVYMLSLRERMELDLEARLMGETLVLNRSLDHFFRDYIEINDLNVPLELRRDQVNDLIPTIEEGEVVEARNDARMVSNFFRYPSYCDHDKKIRIDCGHNLKFSCMIVEVFTELFKDPDTKEKLETSHGGFKRGRHGGGTGVLLVDVGRGKRRPREVKDERDDDLNGQGIDHHLGANWGCRGSQWECRGGQWGSTRLLDDHYPTIAKPLTRHASSFLVPSHEMQKLESDLWNHAMVEARAMLRILDRFHEFGLELVSTIGTGNAFATTANPIGRENTSTWPKCTTCNSYHAPGGPCRTCFNCNYSGHLEKDCRGVPRNVNHINDRNPIVRACYECGSTDHVRPACPRLNRAQGLEGNHPNQVVANNGSQGRRNQGNQARGRAFMLGAEEARQDPNIM